MATKLIEKDFFDTDLETLAEDTQAYVRRTISAIANKSANSRASKGGKTTPAAKVSKTKRSTQPNKKVVKKPVIDDEDTDDGNDDDGGSKHGFFFEDEDNDYGSDDDTVFSGDLVDDNETDDNETDDNETIGGLEDINVPPGLGDNVPPSLGDNVPPFVVIPPKIDAADEIDEKGLAQKVAENQGKALDNQGKVLKLFSEGLINSDELKSMLELTVKPIQK